MNNAAATPTSQRMQLLRVSPKSIERAVNALLKWRDSTSKTQKPQLLEHEDFVYLIVTLKKIPQKGNTIPEKVPLPHALINPVEDSSELCLIVDDRPKSQLTKDAAMKKIKSENIPVSKVIKLSKLKTDYRPFEAKRKLCDSYDMFFADRRVIPLLPRLLGKQFFKKKKIPVAVDLKHTNWKEQIENACGSALFFMGAGTCSVVRVGKVSMESQGIAENVMAAIDGVANVVPSKWKNIRSLHLKLLDSLALPVYQSTPDLKLKIEASKNEKDADEENNGGKLLNGNDEKSKNDSSSIKKKKGRIHGVRYMDSNISEMLGDEEIGGDSEESENDETGSDQFVGKKRKKLGKAESKKPVKLAKLKKGSKDNSKDGVEKKQQKKIGEESVGVESKTKK